jgi:hypothetical protein
MRGVIRWAHGLLGFKLLAPIDHDQRKNDDTV